MKRLAATLGLTAMLILGGCGGDDNGGGGGFTPPKTVVDVKAGTWSLSASINLAACGIPVISDNLDPRPVCTGLDVDDFLTAFPIDCEVTVSGNTIRVNCEGTLPAGNCVYDVTAQGTGNVTGSKDAVAVNGTITLSLKTGDPRQCDYGNGCAGTFTMIGSWLKSEPCSQGATVAFTEHQFGRFLMGPVLGGSATP